MWADTRVIGVAAALGSAAAWAMGTILLKGVGDRVPSLAMTLAKGVLSLGLLAVPLLLTGAVAIAPADLALLAASGLLGIALGDTCFFEALKDLDAAALLALMLAGVALTPLCAVVFLREPATLPRAGGVALVLGGIAVVLSAPGASGASRPTLRGVAFGLAAVACTTASTLAAKRALDAVPALEATFVRMAAGTGGVLALGAATGRLRRWTAPFAARALRRRFALAVAVVTFGGFWLSLVALRHVDVTVASTLGATEPLFALPLAAVILGQRPTLRGLSGCAVASAGIAFLSRA
jgi:drug/metabolite transporter (DMT)-like permease